MRTIRGEVIKELRQQKGWNQRELATAARVNQSVISRIERNIQQDVMLSIVAALADIFGVSIDSLTNKPSTSHPTLIPEVDALITVLAEQPEQVQRHVAGMVRGYLATLP